MQTDYVDLYQMHAWLDHTPIGETVEALSTLQKEGRLRAFALSNNNVQQLEHADRTARERGAARFASTQNYYNLLATGAEKDVLPACARLGMSFLPYMPLARGFLTGRFQRTPLTAPGSAASKTHEATFRLIEALEDFAKERGRTLLELAFAGLAAHPQVSSMIAGASRPEQVRANAAAVTWEMTADDVAALRKLTSSPDVR